MVRYCRPPAWETLYTVAAEGLDVLATVGDAVAWANDFVRRIEAAGA